MKKRYIIGLTTLLLASLISYMVFASKTIGFSNLYTKDEIDSKLETLSLETKSGKVSYEISTVTINYWDQLVTITGSDTGNTPSCYRIVYATSQYGANLTNFFTRNYCETSLTNLRIIRDLKPGDYYVFVQPIDSEGNEGDFSNAVKITYKDFITYKMKYGTGKGSGIGQFSNPLSLSSDNNNRLIVGDYSSHRIVRFDPDNFLASYEVLVGDTDLDGPIGVYYDSGEIWVTEHSQDVILKFNLTTDASASYASAITNPWAVYKDVDGKIWVNGSFAYFVRFDPADDVGTYTKIFENEMPTSAHGFCVDNNDYIWSHLDELSIIKFSRTNPTSYTRYDASGDLNFSKNGGFVCLDDGARIFVNGGTGKIVKFNESDIYNTVLEWGQIGKSDYGLGCNDISQLLLTKIGDDLYVPDRYNNRIMRYQMNKGSTTFTP